MVMKPKGAVVPELPRSFNDLISTSDKPVLVDFWAAWCGPCQMMSPIVGQIAKSYTGRLITVKVNVDEKQHIAAQYQISNIPTVMMFWKGQILLQIMGVQSFEQIKQQIDAHWPVIQSDGRGT
jgi:thioredoxin